MTCWAKCLGDCAEKQSREHIVSQALFISETVIVQGFNWCKDAPKEIGLSNLTAKILCRKHNSDLSPLDSTAGAAFGAMREMRRLANVRAALRPRIWTVARYEVQGPELERWFLKTLINLAYEGPSHIGRDSTESGQPSKRLVEVCFGVTKFQAGAGLYSVVHIGQEIHSADIVRFAPILTDQKYLIGGLYIFRGFRYFLNLEEVNLERLPQGIGFPGEDWGNSQLNFHNRRMYDKVGSYTSQIFATKW